MKTRMIFFLLLLSVIRISPARAADTEFAGNFIAPETQTGFREGEYEVKTVRKLQRGAENFFLSPVEIFHGIKTEMVRKEADYLPFSVESFFVGTVRGIGNGFKRAGVGFYEMITFPYPQKPVLEELDDWLY